MWWAVVGYLGIILLVFQKTLLPPAGWLIWGDDIHHQYYFYRQFFNSFLREGIFPWWNPYTFAGTPFIANPVVNIWYPPTWLFTLLPLNLAYSWHLAFHIFWAMLGMYFLLKTVNCKLQNGKTITNEFTTELGAWVAGVVFGLSGFFMARVWGGHVDVIAAASWMPWVVGAFWRLVSPEVGGGGALLGITFLAHPPGPSPSKSLAPSPHGMAVLKKGRLVAPFSRLSMFIGCQRQLVSAALIFAMQLFAGYQTMAFLTVIAVTIAILFNCYIVKNIQPLLRGLSALLLGVGLAGIQIIPVAEFFRQSIRTFHLPYSWNSYGSLEPQSLKQLLLPFFFGDQRTYQGPPPNFVEHAAFVGVSGMALAIVALIGSWIGKKKRRLVVTVMFAVIAIFSLWVSLGPNAPVDLQRILWEWVPMYRYLRIPPRHLILFVFGMSGLVGFGVSLIRKRTIRVLIVFITTVELVLFARHFIEVRPVPEARHDQELIKLLPGKGELVRVLPNFGVWVPPRDALDFDSVMAYRIFSATGYDPSILKNYYEFVANAAGKKGEQAVLDQDVQVPYLTPAAGEALDFLNIKYLMVPPAYDPFGGHSRYRLLKEDASRQYRLYENTTVLPRFYLSDRSCGSVTVSSYTLNRIELAVDSTCDASLISSEVWYPGWEAYIDGKKVRIDKLNGVFRVLFVNRGKHTISYSYRPWIFFWGLAISGFTALGLWFFLAKNHAGPDRT